MGQPLRRLRPHAGGHQPEYRHRRAPAHGPTAFYNTSTCFDLNIGRYDPVRNDMPGAGGDGRDYGLRFDLFGDQLTLQLNHCENALCPPRVSNQINQVRAIFFNTERRVVALDPTAPTINVTAGHKHGYRTAGRPHDFIRPDFSSHGYEAELNFSPTRSRNIRLNSAKSEAVESHIGAP